MQTTEQQLKRATSARRLYLRSSSKYRANKPRPVTPTDVDNLLSDAAKEAISNGSIPDLRDLCHDLHTIFRQTGWQNILMAAPILRALATPDSASLERFEANPETRHVLIDNEQMKVVLIHWVPGAVSSLHGHPKGGCLFKVLKGTVEELRCAAEGSHQLYARSNYFPGSIAYLDDHLGHHVVGNPSNSPAISVHVYLK